MPEPVTVSPHARSPATEGDLSALHCLPAGNDHFHEKAVAVKYG